MSFFEILGNTISALLLIFCPCIHSAIFSAEPRRRCLKKALGFLGGFALGQIYYNYLLKKIPFPYYFGIVLSVVVSVILGIGNAISRQIRCISVLLLPMYCGKPGRGVMKAVVLTYVIAGPITNLCLNAREVVRVFACSAELSANLSSTRHRLMMGPVRHAMYGLKPEIGQVKDTMRSIREVFAPIEREIEGIDDLSSIRIEDEYIDDVFSNSYRSHDIENKYSVDTEDDENEIYRKKYMKKMEYRCQNQITKATGLCIRTFAAAYKECSESMPAVAVATLCWPLRVTYVCNVMHIVGGSGICDARERIDPGIGEGYSYLKKANKALDSSFKDVKFQYKISNVDELRDIQSAKETGERVTHAFEEKMKLIRYVIIAVHVFVAILFLRIVSAAVLYHDEYLTSIDFDNHYVTGYFKHLDERRRACNKYTLLPLKKMETRRYTDVNSTSYMPFERHKLFTQVLKVTLEMITATTLVMLERLFYEALDVVRRHAEVTYTQEGVRNLEIEVEGTGMLANIVRRVISSYSTRQSVRHTVSNAECLPRPRAMPLRFYLYIYGGYLWILVLLYVNAYTVRMSRLICSYFYPRREKQRILHLYNDILKKRMKLKKTLQKKAIVAVRAHFLSSENLLSLRMKFPMVLGWTKLFSAGRNKCLICGEREPRRFDPIRWHHCPDAQCPFVYCAACWQEVGARCLFCQPGQQTSELWHSDWTQNE